MKKNKIWIMQTVLFLAYAFCLYELCELCQWGGVRQYTLRIGIAGVIAIFSGILWLLQKKDRRQRVTGLMTVVLLTALFAARVAYLAKPYNGKLAWQVDAWKREKKIVLTQTNIYENGIDTILAGIREKVKMPDELYITDNVTITFNKEGIIQTVDTFLYGKDAKGKTKTFLVSYDVRKSNKMTVWIDGYANAVYDENMKLEPMLTILQKADMEIHVATWAEKYQASEFEILYYGKRSFQTPEGLLYLGEVSNEAQEYRKGNSGGAVNGYEVSLYAPKLTAADTTGTSAHVEAAVAQNEIQEEQRPVRYMLNPEYISQQILWQRQKEKEDKAAKENQGYTTTQSDGTETFFLNDTLGWHLVVTDAAAGSRYYELEKTSDGGQNWERIHTDPFAGNAGVAEGIFFLDEMHGFIGLSGASQTHSTLFYTADGGMSFEEMKFPTITTDMLPTTAATYGFTVKDYLYYTMPELQGDELIVRVLSQAGESDGVIFMSADGGVTWQHV